MKKFIITLLVAALPAVTFAQSAFDKFNDVEGIEAVSISGDMFKMIGGLETSEDDDSTQQMLNQVKNIQSLKVFTTSEKKYRKEITTAVADYLKAKPLEELMSINEKNNKIKIYVNQGGDANLITEGLVFIQDIDDKNVVLVSFTGNINLNDLKNLKGFKGPKGPKGSK
ncbi:DUF4252 domain-containing protein [Flavobacterium zepuense]|uniref:DUF4252 domain-containing protein n=1 Tax=Flavobacterium zepuense TaxID=2593302 RepID=A0A552V2Z7_9FLAO|nr:DUF4252 domain-containing protein [Flavobacterium zepuense]TRW24860.1 DUF4252 domain-containing protein [Flavobacterium zepuense]